MPTSNKMPLSERETRLTKAVMPRGWLRKRPIEERDTQLTQCAEVREQVARIGKSGAQENYARSRARLRASRGRSVDLQEPQKRRRRWLVLLAISVLVLVCLGIFISFPLLRKVSPLAPAPDTSLEHALHPQITPDNSTAIGGTVERFMSSMQQKDWSTLWRMLSPDAQLLWQGEQDFMHFEQSKFGALTLRNYKQGQAVISTPWLDPDTTHIYSSAALVNVSLLASAPAGLLTGPSQQDLKGGLFKGTAFALVQVGQNWQVALAGPADLDAPVLVPARPPVSHLLIPIYMYHHISNLPTHNQLDFSLTVTLTDFNAQLNWMQQQGYHAITMTELFDAFYDGKALPSRPMILTFDDGYADVYTYALPALLAHHYRGVFYIITGMIGGSYVSWKEVRDLDRSGMQIASHTVHHINLGQPPAGTTVQNELVKSKAKLESILKEPIQFFCYPTGEPFHHDTLAEQQIVLNDLFNDGYLGATLDPASFNSALQNSALPYEMPRIRVSGGENLSEFVGILLATLRADAVRLKALK
ncbi:MAG TPA: polysaccharide deacetylase family protein [Ktedonobacteraceae bacterium]